mgnify:CR=1 FL=1
MRFLIIFIFIISNSLADEAIIIKNLVINKELKKYDGLTFLDLNNTYINLSDFQGNLILLNFWATWCAPCRREMPSLEKLTHQLPEIKVYAINMERPNKLKAQDFFKFIGVLSLDIYFDPELKLVKQFKMRGLPTSILIDKNGMEFGRIVGEVDFVDEKFLQILKKYI